jgi:hypothetical protein
VQYTQCNVHETYVIVKELSLCEERRDGIKDRNNDILDGDRTSHYEEKMAHLIADYANFGTQMRELADEAICQVKETRITRKTQHYPSF